MNVKELNRDLHHHLKFNSRDPSWIKMTEQNVDNKTINIIQQNKIKVYD